MRTLFVPAIIDGLANVSKRCLWLGNRFGMFKDKHDCSWYTDMAIFKHEYALTSYFYSQKDESFRNKQRMTDDTILFADSGGYTVATKGAKIDPHKVLKWQEKNSNIAFTLDIPPTIVTSGNQISPGKNERVSREVFEQFAERSRQNNLVFYNNREREDLQIYNVIHGHDVEQYDLWWDYCQTDTPFEGFATGPKPSGDMLLQAMSIMYLWNKGVRKNVHLLGVAGITVIPVLVWASQYIDKISFDSTSYGYGSLTRAYVYPERIRDYTHFGGKFKHKVKPMTEIYCKCPICINFKDPAYFCGGGTSWPGMLLSLHNLWCVKQYVEELENALHVEKDIPKFYKLIDQHTGTTAHKTKHAINFIEDTMKIGFKKTCDMYLQDYSFMKPKFVRRKLI